MGDVCVVCDVWCMVYDVLWCMVYDELCMVCVVLSPIVLCCGVLSAVVLCCGVWCGVCSCVLFAPAVCYSKREPNIREYWELP